MAEMFIFTSLRRLEKRQEIIDSKWKMKHFYEKIAMVGSVHIQTYHK